jgi:hypothetical protein
LNPMRGRKLGVPPPARGSIGGLRPPFLVLRTPTWTVGDAWHRLETMA